MCLAPLAHAEESLQSFIEDKTFCYQDKDVKGKELIFSFKQNNIVEFFVSMDSEIVDSDLGLWETNGDYQLFIGNQIPNDHFIIRDEKKFTYKVYQVDGNEIYFTFNSCNLNDFKNVDSYRINY